MLVNGIAVALGDVAALARRSAGLPDLAQRLGLAVDRLASSVWLSVPEQRALLRVLDGDHDPALDALRDSLRGSA